MRRSSIIAGLCFLALASCGGQSNGPQTEATSPKGPQASGATYLSEQELMHSVVGRRFSSTTSRGLAFTVEFASGGTGTVTFSGTPRPLTWTINGDVLCFGTVVNGQRQSECDRVRPAGGRYDFVDSTTGALNNTYTPI